MTVFKKQLQSKLKKNISQYFSCIKPSYSKLLTPVLWRKITDLLYSMIFAQSSFVKDIAVNTNHYIKRKKGFERGERKSLLNLQAQMKKISSFLFTMFDVLPILIFSYLQYVTDFRYRFGFRERRDIYFY